MRRLLALLVVALMASATGALGLSPVSAQSGDSSRIEADFVARINDLRRARGLQELAVHDELVTVARGWAASMASADRISHNPRLNRIVRADWKKLGENVGVGMTVDKLMAAFIASPTHFRNLVDPDFEWIGVGVVFASDGAIFTAHQFMELRSTSGALARPTGAPDEAGASEQAGRATELDLGSAGLAAGSPTGAPARVAVVLEQLRALDDLAGRNALRS